MRGYASHPLAEVVAVCDLDETRARKFGAEHEIEGVYTSFERMVAEAGIEAVDIAIGLALEDRFWSRWPE